MVAGIFTEIGRFAVRFRWLVVVAWIVAAFAVPSMALPSLSSVTQNDNAGFLSASVPSVHASDLASVFQPANQYRVHVIAYRSDGQLTTADITALGQLASQLHGVTGVTAVKDLGRSANGSAEQFEVLFDGLVVNTTQISSTALRPNHQRRGRHRHDPSRRPASCSPAHSRCSPSREARKAAATSSRTCSAAGTGGPPD